MTGNLIITAFLTLPIAEAIVGQTISGIKAFSKENIQSKINKNPQNGTYKSFKVVEIEVNQSECKKFENVFIIPRTSKAVIKNCHDVYNFMGMTASSSNSSQ